MADGRTFIYFHTFLYSPLLAAISQAPGYLATQEFALLVACGIQSNKPTTMQWSI